MDIALNLVSTLTEKALTLCTAESCTGGGIGAAITAAPGASQCFRGGIIAYANAVKVAMLGVSPSLLAAEGAVSEPVALAMAQGARKKLGTDIAVSVTGIAGPSGGTVEKPVGCVFVGVSCERGDCVEAFRFQGDRERVRQQTVVAALKRVLKVVEA